MPIYIGGVSPQTKYRVKLLQIPSATCLLHLAHRTGQAPLFPRSERAMVTTSRTRARLAKSVAMT